MDRSHVKGILNTRVEEYLLEAASDLKITDANIHDKTILRSTYGCKWARYEMEEEKFMKKLEQQKADFIVLIKTKLYEQQGKAIVDGNANDIMMNTKALSLAKKAPQYQKIEEQIRDQEEIIRCVAEIKKLIYQMTYDITNVRSIMALEQ